MSSKYKKPRLTQFGYLIDKLYKIDAFLGGNEKNKSKKKNQFGAMKDFIVQKMHAVNKKQDQRDDALSIRKGNRDQQIILYDTEIKQYLADIERELKNMDNLLNKQVKQKKYPKDAIQHNDSFYANLCEQLKIIKDRESSGVQGISHQEKVQTLEELKKMLMETGKYRPNVCNVEPDDEELQAMQRWEQDKKIQDDILDEINNNLDEWLGKHRKIDEAIDQTAMQLQIIDGKADGVIEELESQNSSLKKLLVEFRKPSKFCCDVILFLLLLGLVYLMYSLIKKGK